MTDIRTWPEQAGNLESYNEIRSANSRMGRYRLQGVKCKSCMEIYFPERFVCPKCHSRDLEHYFCAKTGKIDTFWIDFRFAPVGYGDIEHRIIAIVTLDDGLTLITEIVDCPKDKVENGMRVEMTIRKLRRSDTGNVLYGYKFRPIEIIIISDSSDETKKYSPPKGHPAHIKISSEPLKGHPKNIPINPPRGHPSNIQKTE